MTGDDRSVSRRAILAATGSAVALSTAGSAHDDESSDETESDWSDRLRRCPEATIQPSMTHCRGASMDGCSDDHPATQKLQNEVRTALERRYPDIGAIIERGYKPYFDTVFDGGDDASGGWSHWLNPEYIGDDETLNPDRPESILVDNEWWRPIGAMFIATRSGEPIERPPAVYGEGGSESEGEDEDETETTDERCSPWHSHTGLPGRFAWWYYRQTYEGAYRDGELLLPCRTPCLLHVWTVPHPDGVYAHGGPPRANRGGPPAEDPGFDTDARPGEDELDWDVLPEDVVPETKPDEWRARLGLVS
ncbi:hypothetical protein OB955_07125 [Halobacteria archaeon AArc-m2/3/4]|uniref:Uncharacterized protein n=1 Tax=Natronoglomus mannanivorans TaxID=2979990 RepID=A0ABT2QC55_9EURY|nr:hypothetical protein [Halobacteria archaeon AArc-m2/3/4]